MINLFFNADFGSCKKAKKIVESNYDKILMGSGKGISSDGVSYHLKFANRLHKEIVSVQLMSVQYLNKEQLHKRIAARV